jgi:hypothetical protein
VRNDEPECLWSIQIVAKAQIFNDRQLLRNGEAMQKILLATEAETALSRQIASQSQQMTEEMKNDSNAMSTVSASLNSNRISN